MKSLLNSRFPKGFPPLKSLIFFLLLFSIFVIFFIAGAAKLGEVAAFSADIQNYRILNREWSFVLALYLPWLEMVASGCLLLPRLRSAGLAICLGLLVIFLGAIVLAWIRGLDINCGCFGSVGGKVDYLTLILRDLAMLGVTGVLIIREFSKEAVWSVPEPGQIK